MTAKRMPVATVQHDRLFSLLTGDNPPPIWLLGAGASLRSGIPLSGEVVERVARWAYCRDHGRPAFDPSVRRSDWWPWLEEHGWYRRDQSTSDNYHATIQHLLQPREDRKRFFLQLLKPGVPPSIGYVGVVDLMAAGLIRNILTTNFDNVLAQACQSSKTLHHVEVIKTPDDYTKISTEPEYPQIIHLHGSVEHYTDKNLLEEVEKLDEQLVERLVPLIRDHPIIVLGYRGAEPSVMTHLFAANVERTHDFRHGIFWCARGSSAEPRQALVTQLASRIGNNFVPVTISDFDELFIDLKERCAQTVPATRFTWHVPAMPPPIADLPFDMGVAEAVNVEDLDWDRIQSVAIEYSDRMGIPLPERIGREWLLDWLCGRDLAKKAGNVVAVTRAAVLLFGRYPQRTVPCARVRVAMSGESTIEVAGHLWDQLAALTGLTDSINRPYLRKGERSQKTFPYPRLALREAIVNALVHRRYDEDDAFVTHLQIDQRSVRLRNPGGLVDDVLHAIPAERSAEAESVSEVLQGELSRGRSGLKGYRNPLLADVLYGAGAMEKAGSGLTDVIRLVRENGGRVDIHLGNDNESFEIILYSPDEGRNSSAGPVVVRTEHFTTNLLEIKTLPTVLWRAPTQARHPNEIMWKDPDVQIPPIVISDGFLYSFADLRDVENPVRRYMEVNKITAVEREGFLSLPNGERRLVWLLNAGMYKHCSKLGLIVDEARKRAYFPRDEVGAREVTYRARLRRATRTVTKPLVSKTTQQVRFWQHEAVRFQFRRFGGSWTLQLLPGYVFTKDGDRELLEGPRSGPLATRRSARDYNPHVEGDLYFWTAVLSQEQDRLAIDMGGRTEVIVDATPVNTEVVSSAALTPETIEVTETAEGPDADIDVDEIDLENDSEVDAGQ